MKRFTLATLAIPLVWLGMAAVPAAAQNAYPFQQPRYGPGWQTPLSPWLNMLIPGNAAVNYFALVEPQFQRRQYFNQINTSLQGLVNQIPPPLGIMTEEEFNAPMRSTGHPTAFNYTGTYFSGNTIAPAAISPFAQRRIGMGAGTMGPGGRPGFGGTRGAGVWPNMRPGMGSFGR